MRAAGRGTMQLVASTVSCGMKSSSRHGPSIGAACMRHYALMESSSSLLPETGRGHCLINSALQACIGGVSPFKLHDS